MTTANDIVKGALTNIGYIEAETPIESSDAQTAFEEFNDMMTELEPQIQLGFVEVTTLASEVRIPREAVSAIKWTLGLRVAPKFRIPLTAEQIAVGNAAFNNLLINQIHLNPPKYPPELPIGAGNECDDYQRFYESEGEDNF